MLEHMMTRNLFAIAKPALRFNTAKGGGTPWFSNVAGPVITKSMTQELPGLGCETCALQSYGTCLELWLNDRKRHWFS